MERAARVQRGGTDPMSKQEAGGWGWVLEGRTGVGAALFRRKLRTVCSMLGTGGESRKTGMQSLQSRIDAKLLSLASHHVHSLSTYCVPQ